ncbi:hypothetical protein BDR26DRAFT_937393 [Obelidium mucronatum]|nr:hypothetical protein BDR26DRAFT_937393 [Obelidium mucronatum]
MIKCSCEEGVTVGVTSLAFGEKCVLIHGAQVSFGSAKVFHFHKVRPKVMTYPVVESDYILGSLLGSGTTSSIFHVTAKSTSAELAKKVIKQSSFEGSSEVTVLGMLKESRLGDDNVYIIIELLSGPILSAHVTKAGAVSEDVTRDWAVQLLALLQEILGSKKIIHGDLNSTNVIYGGGHVELFQLCPR